MGKTEISDSICRLSRIYNYRSLIHIAFVINTCVI